MAAARWEFWIDVGGTFTDCIARAPDGAQHRHKLLSSGVTKGRVAEGATRNSILDPSRTADPPDFWVGWRFVLVDEVGGVRDQSTVIAFDHTAGRLYFDELRHSPAPRSAYELRTDLEAPIIAIRYLLRLPLAEPIPPVSLRLGTTRGTNALITRRGARTALVTTQGFADVLEIGYQARPRLFDLAICKSPSLATTSIEVDERVTHDGNVLVALQEAVVRQQMQALRDAGIESLAVCLLHADRYPAHEEVIARIAGEVGFSEISASYEVAPLPKIVARADTTVVDAYLNPVLRDYVARLRAALPGTQIRLLTSAGGLVGAEQFRGKDSILSGPAGGVVGYSRVAQAAGFPKAIGFDMGGTSTDVSRFDGRFELEYETQKAGVRLVAPTMAIETVAAGGGSICRFDGVKLAVGPESAGADPGPACYGRGGPLTVTDCNLYLGRIAAERFPFPLDHVATERRLHELANEMQHATGEAGVERSEPPVRGPTGRSPSARRQPSDAVNSLAELAAGLLRIANANMAAAIRLVSIAKGADPADYLLVAFGAAAPQHACAVARELGIGHVLVHPDASILSAVGIGVADVVRHRSRGVERPLDAVVLEEVRNQLQVIERNAIEEVVGEGVPRERITARRSLDLRYRGVDSYLTIPWPEDDDLLTAFTVDHRARYGYIHEARPLEIAAARVEAVGRVATALPRSGRVAAIKPASHSSVPLYIDGQRQPTPAFERAELAPGSRITGPALIVERLSCTVVDPGWDAEVLTGGELLLSATANKPGEEHGLPTAEREIHSTPDPVFLEVFNNRVANIAEQMGVTLRNTASSVNVKERLDFSCAIFTSDGRLVANAPHVPVHLGAMEETVRYVLAANTELQPGDVFATNDPYAGGSHLPDVTVVTPVHDAAGNQLFFTASRAHHAEIGGIAPGSMPPLSKCLAEEGVLIENMRIVAVGESRFDELRKLLLAGPYPTRDVEANLADIAAQVAANRQGADQLLAMVDRYSTNVVQAYMEHVQDAAEQKVRQALSRFPTGARSFTDYLESADGISLPISVTWTIDGDQAPAATIDFTGTGPVVAGNLNANRAIVTAAVIYVLRVLVDEDIPLNHGVLRPIEIVLPACFLNPKPGATPETSPAVAGGNVETSQRVVDVLLGALGIAGASQGTMNNVLFGDGTFGYYETIAGGSGATADAPGASAVQIHMTNTRSTDPEILERRYPVRVREFSIRRGSGGAGRHRGGDGTVRRLEFLRPLTLSLLTERRGPHPPYGTAGGEPGALGRNYLIDRDGSRIELPGIIQSTVEAGITLVVETPGGGGFGKALQ